MAKPADKWAAARFWFADSKAAFGLALGAVLVAGLFILILFPFAPPLAVTGTVIGLGVEEQVSLGTFPVAVVRLDRLQATVSLPRGNRCRIGGRITLLRYRAILGWRFTAATSPCPASWNGITGPLRPAARKSGG